LLYKKTPKKKITGNWLEGTINLQGQDSKTSGLDYVMRAAHLIYPNGVHGVVADMWKDCEGILFDGCGGASATELTAFILDISGLSANQPIYVEMKDSNNVLYWLYSYDGNTWMQYYSYTPPSTFLQVFYLGTVNIISGPYYTAYYYQFGFWSQSWFSGVYFNVEIQNPAYYQSGSWHTVQTAESMQGPYTYFDETWTYANAGFGLSSALNLPQPTPQVTFYAPCGTKCGLADNTVLWG
jgi:hypothetical protein